jgi:hypothetical protein
MQVKLLNWRNNEIRTETQISCYKLDLEDNVLLVEGLPLQSVPLLCVHVSYGWSKYFLVKPGHHSNHTMSDSYDGMMRT